ncbi:hypothetical protein JTB14_032772 [Gonioctena quinquepunctata]|nr:hypothetical protein JTB14_032772 [Gonioctena quinquepunctata]
MVDTILRANEYTHEFGEGPIKSYDSSQLGSNNPMEDTRSEATCLLTKAMLFGVFDGHSGGACAQVIAKRIFHYMTACLLPHDVLTNYLQSLAESNPYGLVQAHNDNVQFVDDIRDLYADSFLKFLKDLAQLGHNKENVETAKSIEKAVLRLDEDMSNEALPKEGVPINLKTMSVAMSGAVVCVAHVDGSHLHMANVGDCCARFRYPFGD